MASANPQPDRTAQARIVQGRLVCSGHWTVRHLAELESQLKHLPLPAGPLDLDLAAVPRMDTGGALVLHELIASLRQANHEVRIEGLSPKARGLLELVGRSLEQDGMAPMPPQRMLLERLGRGSLAHVQAGVGMLAFIGEIGVAWMHQLLHPGRIRWKEVADNLVEAGHRALGIVGLLSFLLGIVIAYQGGVQLRQYGASLFVADLVGLSMVRELAPIITAIIVAGRTGSAYTAQIGTMKVTEEVDALRSMGIPPMELLVLPKLLALIIALPLLTVFADIMGILGGMVMSSVQLDIAFSTFIQRIGTAVSLESFLVGVGKAPVFAVIIATIGCYQGFQVVGSAESVGRRTTISVVQAILAVIVVDAAFSVAFSHLGI
jgi:phospholipid/cholesterol/gamma-HCH transport system permease protein